MVEECLRSRPSAGRDGVDTGGFTTLTAEVLTGNGAMLGLMRALGLPQRTVRDVEVTTVVTALTALDLPDDRRERARRHIARAGAALRSG